jgi:SLBB domain-containing protein
MPTLSLLHILAFVLGGLARLGRRLRRLPRPEAGLDAAVGPVGAFEPVDLLEAGPRTRVVARARRAAWFGAGLAAGAAAWVAGETAWGSGGLSPPPPPRPALPPLRVQVDGGVARPGVYELSPGARVEDALRAAGGPTDRADAGDLNLVARLSDGQRLTVGRRSPSPAETTPAAGATDAAGAARPPRPPPERTPRPAASSAPTAARPSRRTPTLPPAAPRPHLDPPDAAPAGQAAPPPGTPPPSDATPHAQVAPPGPPSLAEADGPHPPPGPPSLAVTDSPGPPTGS